MASPVISIKYWVFIKNFRRLKKEPAIKVAAQDVCERLS